MPICTVPWKVTAQPEQLPKAFLRSEKLLEDMMVTQWSERLLRSPASARSGRQCAGKV